ncbi:aromatase/cyclase [Actinophytocola xanthii]|uniref:Coenzyme Q-binding protein COQ10 START domain-containing protein n=1 Tax=Actinophytocola xanthii TaxID=1912961 RepID=A0A1Q8CT80_9PSEU|nr:aromatase/cyclase [Actinophytocola xanthii]OLF17547.1 hypothetical protein BU204_11525 [Actinophytocola xanthii]
MTELSIWTARRSVTIAAPPRRVYQLVADIDRWPALFGAVRAVEHLGVDATGERLRLWGTVGGRTGSWLSSRAANPKRLQVRFRHESVLPPLVSLGGLWLVVPKGGGSHVELAHYFRVVDDSPAEASRLEQVIAATSGTLLASLREAAEGRWLPLAQPVEVMPA